MQKYIRLLNYETACKVIKFVNENKNNYASITTGGVSIQVKEDWDKIEAFIKFLNVKYEVGTEHPTKVKEQIVTNLKSKGIIK